MRKQSWAIPILVILALVGLALTAPRWVPFLARFVQLNTDLIQGLADLVQLLLWIAAGALVLLRGLGWRREAPGSQASPANRYQATPDGSSALVRGNQNTVASAGSAAIGQLTGLAVLGDDNVIVLAGASADALWQHWLPQKAAPADLRDATARYLRYLLDRYRFLEFKGMGANDRLALRLPLSDMYVPLKARIEMPEGDTWARALRLAGGRATAEEVAATGERMSGPLALLDLLQKHQGLIILGDPGAGKTTFLKYLAVALAAGQAEALGLSGYVPLLLPLSAYANALATREDLPLKQFIPDYYRSQDVELPLAPVFHQALTEGHALVLLDGLDEVRSVALRHQVLQRVLSFCAFYRARGNKFVLTSRIVGYHEVRSTATIEGLIECTLWDFDDDEIEQFVDKWTSAIERAARGDTPVAATEAARERAELLAALRRNPGVRQLATNPLLLTILALMKRQGVTLPERRVELYQRYVETLLKHWNLARSLGRPLTRDLDLIETLRVLAPLALWMHETSQGKGLVKREDVKRRLASLFAERGAADPEHLAEDFLGGVRGDAGLLVERGLGEYGFIHLTFQEYLAAVALAQRGQQGIGPVVDALATHVSDANWREVSRLTIGYLGIVQQREEAATAVLDALLRQAPGQPGEAVILAGEAVADAWPGGVTATCHTAVLDALLATMEDHASVQPPVRAEAGRTLARLGDPRPEALTTAEMQFCYVPAGPFWMGSQDDPDAEDNEQPQRQVDLAYDYWIGRYPVTNAQFGEFAAAGGYREARYWYEAKAAGYWSPDGFKGWLDNAPRQKPYDLGEPRNLSNHPVAAVSWYEALAYTRWLHERLVGRIPAAWKVRLPNEPEWEKAARGGVKVPAQNLIRSASAGLTREAPPLQSSPQPRRRYPWGHDPDANRANSEESGIGTTSAVGCFAGGASVYGVEDLSGNVWEWTRSLWGSDYQKPRYGYPYVVTDGRENLAAGSSELRVLRGGSYYNNRTNVRCARRYRYYPFNWNDFRGFRVVVSP
ncbi:NACHT domain-containing protein [Candidatus Amarolinea aalborgensis]|uniref:NACHT domain-containing protein n=1 Tax=Candidatus Amarolinea aalborgensis TaxID=2249329 RepID=UPI003BFA2940